MSADCGSESTEVERIGTRGEQGGQAPPRRLPVYVAEVPAGPQHRHPPRPRSRAEVLGGVTVGAAVSSYGVQVILDEGVDDESVCRRSDGGDWKAAGATSG